MDKNTPFYVTTPIYYVNDIPHIGHAYTTIAADIMARFARMQERDVFFMTGTDEHGAKIAKAALTQHMEPQEYVDKLSVAFRHMTEKTECTVNHFIRTTDATHKKAAQHFWSVLQDKGFIRKAHYEGWYAIRDEAYYTEAEVIQTENGPVGPTGAPVEWMKEECYFFMLSLFQEKLIAHYRAHPDAIVPKSRYNEVMKFLESGLHDLAVSRSHITWGIPVPGDKNHVMYVWIDALVNYISGLGYSENKNLMDHFWPQAIHIIGKDILRFHAVYWPAFLMAADIPCPKTIVTHGWWTVEGEKMSKSLGNVVNPLPLIEEYGADTLRYFLFRQGTFGQDCDFSVERLAHTRKHELCDGLGNLVHRVLSFMKNNCAESTFPPERIATPENNVWYWGTTHKTLLEDAMKRYALSEYLEYVYAGIMKGNQAITQLAPWVLKKSSDPASHISMVEGLWSIVHLIRDIAVMIMPFTPDTSLKIYHMLGYKREPLYADIGTLITTPIVYALVVPLFSIEKS